jgi:hypothetical protein
MFGICIFACSVAFGAVGLLIGPLIGYFVIKIRNHDPLYEKLNYPTSPIVQKYKSLFKSLKHIPGVGFYPDTSGDKKIHQKILVILENDEINK